MAKGDIATDIRGLQGAYVRGLDPAEVVEHVFAAIEAVGDAGIFISLVDRRTARKAAQKLGRFDPAAKPLWGIPFAVKDNIDAAGLPTTAGCRAFAYKPKASATAVARLLAAGAILIG
jgi:allophanate hydrolase